MVGGQNSIVTVPGHVMSPDSVIAVTAEAYFALVAVYAALVEAYAALVEAHSALAESYAALVEVYAVQVVTYAVLVGTRTVEAVAYAAYFLAYAALAVAVSVGSWLCFPMATAWPGPVPGLGILSGTQLLAADNTEPMAWTLAVLVCTWLAVDSELAIFLVPRVCIRRHSHTVYL